MALAGLYRYFCTRAREGMQKAFSHFCSGTTRIHWYYHDQLKVINSKSNTNAECGGTRPGNPRAPYAEAAGIVTLGAWRAKAKNHVERSKSGAKRRVLRVVVWKMQDTNKPLRTAVHAITARLPNEYQGETRRSPLKGDKGRLADSTFSIFYVTSCNRWDGMFLGALPSLSYYFEYFALSVPKTARCSVFP